MPSTHLHLVGRGLHSETEEPFDLEAREGRVRAFSGHASERETWLSPDWARVVDPFELNGRWQHYKGPLYEVFGRAETAAGATLVVYTSSDGRVWLRPAEMWQEDVTVGDYSGPRF